MANYLVTATIDDDPAFVDAALIQLGFQRDQNAPPTEARYHMRSDAEFSAVSDSVRAALAVTGKKHTFCVERYSAGFWRKR